MTIYYITENEKILLFDTDEQRLQNTVLFMPQYQGLTIQETAREIIEHNGEFVFKDTVTDELLAKAKEAKLTENLEKAYEAENNGTVLYKNAVFETSASNISKLTSQFAMIQSGMIESVQWLSKDDIQLDLDAQDIMTLGQLIAEYTSALWNVQYLCFKEQIEQAQSVEALEAIVIDYAASPVGVDEAGAEDVSAETGIGPVDETAEEN